MRKRASSRRLVRASVTDLRQRWGYYFQLSKRADVVICRRGVPVAMLLSTTRYRRLMVKSRELARGSSALGE